MRIFTGWVTSLLFFILGINIPSSHANAPEHLCRKNEETSQITYENIERTYKNIERLDRSSNPKITFTHGQVDWLSQLATQAGWPKKTHEKLKQIILRESGGCPNRRGGDKVDKDCNITGVSEWNHRSDTGLLQINGVNYDLSRNKWARVCLDLDICTQEPLLDPLTNLKAGYLLYQYSGWSPWDPCTWDKTRCPKKKP